MIVVEFPSLEVFEWFIDEAENHNIHPLRRNSTSDYFWTLVRALGLEEMGKLCRLITRSGEQFATA